MKKFLIIAVSGIVIGSIFALYMFSNINNTVASMVVDEEETATAFQVGVFSVYDNAKKEANNYPNSYIYQDGDKYRVFLAIYQDREIIDYMTNYYQSKNIKVYLKKLDVKAEFLEQLNKYEELLIKTNDKETYISANKNILGVFAKTL